LRAFSRAEKCGGKGDLSPAVRPIAWQILVVEFLTALRFELSEENDMAYSEKVVDHYNNPRNVGSLPKEDPNVGTGLVGAPECGDVMKLQMRINPETQVIEEARFKTFGCGSAIASSSLATEWVKGKTVEEALSIKNTDIVRELALPPVKIHCSVLAEDAIKAAIGNWKNKKGIPVPAAEKASH
jgi:nitrogen fixation protein NifU and related proteins